MTLSGMAMPRRGNPAERFVCAECGHGRNLTAFAYGYVGGPLAQDGIELADCDQEFVETEVAKDSIQCSKHEGAELYRRVEGNLCRMVSCERCDGLGRALFRGYLEPCWICGSQGSWWAPVESLGEMGEPRNLEKR